MTRLLSVDNFLSTQYVSPSGTSIHGAVSSIKVVNKAPKADALYAIFLQPSNLAPKNLETTQQQYPTIDWALVKILAKLDDFSAKSGSLIVPDKDENQVMLVGVGKEPTLSTIRTACRSITKRAISSKKRDVILYWPTMPVFDTSGVLWGFGKGVRGTEKSHIKSVQITTPELIDVVVRGLIYNNWSHDLYLQKQAFVVRNFTIVVRNPEEQPISISVPFSDVDTGVEIAETAQPSTTPDNVSKASLSQTKPDVIPGRQDELPEKTQEILGKGAEEKGEAGQQQEAVLLPPDFSIVSLSRALHGAESVSFTRELGSLRFKDATNTYMKDVCVKLSETHSDVLKCTVLDRAQILKEDYNLIASVNQGSWDQCYLVAMEYTPPNLGREAGKEEHEEKVNSTMPPLAFVAKGITFDTGGLDIKGPTSMFNMHGDKNAACNQLGLFRYLGLSRPALAHKVVGVYCITDNAVGSRSVHPHAIVSTASALGDSGNHDNEGKCEQNKAQIGKLSVVNNNTDAEGRLVLADGVTMAQKYFKPGRIITWATLTGAVKNALGPTMAGLFSNCEADELFTFGERNGERFWRLPMIPENFKDIEGPDCDLKNMAGKSRYMGASVAAAFINSFVGDGVDFIHLDIAGVASVAKSGGNEAAGVPCTTIQHYVTSLEIE